MTPPLPPNITKAWQLHQSGRLREAESAYHAILAVDPRNTDAALRLAFLLRQSNRAAKAVTILQKLHSQHPNHPGIIGELASAFLNNGNFNKAQSLFLSLINLKPDFPPAHIGLAQCRLAKQQPGMAVQVLQQANRFIPNNPEILHELGLACLQNGQPNEAVQHLEKSCEIYNTPPPNSHQPTQPVSSRIHKDLGHVLHLVGRLDEAQNHLEKALKYMPADPSVAVYLCELYQSLGHLEEAGQIISERMKTGANHPTLLLAAGKISRRRNNPEQALHYLETVINHKSSMPSQWRASALFEYAATLEKMGEFDRAFDNYAQANALLNYKYNAGAAEQQVDAVISAYTADNISKMHRATVKNETPIFILGMPRSGTTLIEQIIGSHSRAFGAGELPHLGKACSSLLADQRNVKASTGNWDIASVIAASLADLNKYANNYVSTIKSLAPRALRITDKMPLNFYYVGFIAQLLPQARIIHSKRNPLDTCLSIFATQLGPAHKYSTNLQSLSHYYRQYQKLMDHWNLVIDDLGISFTEVQYESVIDNPEQQIRQLIHFCDLDWEDQCLNFHESERPITTASVDQVRRPIYRSSLKRYENFESHLTPLIDALGDILS